MPAKYWRSGVTTTTTSGRTHPSATRPQQKRAGRSSYLMATRPTRLPSLQPMTIKPKDSRYERGTTGGQVNLNLEVELTVDTIGYIPPAEAEKAFYANLNSLDMVA